MKQVFGRLMLLAGGLGTLSFKGITADNDHSMASVRPVPELYHLPSFPGAEGHGSKTRAGEAAK